MKQYRNRKQFSGKRGTRTALLLAGAAAWCTCTCAEMREWTSVRGEIFDAEFISVIGDKVVLRDPEGKQFKILKDRFSEEDRLFIELSNPPELNIGFSKKSEQHIWPQREKTYAAWELPRAFDFVFTAKLKQTSSGSYNHELHVEFFAIGEEIDGDNYILLDRQESTFVPGRYTDDFFKFSGRRVRMFDYEFFQDGRRGQKYGGYLIIVTDPRGKIIAHESPYPWLFKNVEALKELPVGKHFDKSCTRVFPPRPKSGRQKRN